MAIETLLGRYEVERRLGAGGMGDVWLAHDRLLGRPVALKFVGDRELRQTPGAEQILFDEAKVAGRLLGHANVVGVLDLIQVDSSLHTGNCLVMEYVDGLNLAEWISSYRPNVEEPTRTQNGLYLALCLIEAIDAAHILGILHRDIKPQNVLCSKSGQIKVADFGLARLVEAITRSHTVWGRHTPLYAAPEQWQDEKPDRDTDVYQLCATLYHLFAGRPANEGKNIIGLLRWHETGSLTPLSSLVPELDKDVAEAITLGLAKDKSVRPPPWRLYDVVSGAIWPVVEMDLDAEGLDDASVRAIATLTDFDMEDFSASRDYQRIFPNSYEAIRESIGTIILGGRVTLTRLATDQAGAVPTS